MNCDVDYQTLKGPHLKNNVVDSDPFRRKYTPDVTKHLNYRWEIHTGLHAHRQMQLRFHQTNLI